jgi:hypothetical protein
MNESIATIAVGTTVPPTLRSPPARVRPGRLAASIAIAAAVAMVPIGAAFADHDRDRGRGHDRGHDHGRYRVYAPPTVYYPRVESPGISLFFPPIVIR